MVVLQVTDAIHEFWGSRLQMKLFVDDLSIQVRGAFDCLAMPQAAVTFYIQQVKGTWSIPVSRGPGGKGYILAAAASARRRCS
eukprot:6560953-Pyramimonas_sp.AAC.1